MNSHQQFENIGQQSGESRRFKIFKLILIALVITAIVIGGAVWWMGKKPNSTTAPQVAINPTSQEVSTAAVKPQVHEEMPVVHQEPPAVSSSNSIVVGTSGFTICSGPKGGAFEQVVANIEQACGLGLSVKATSGAGDNLTFLHSGQCQFAPVNSDDYWGRVQSGSDPKIKETRTVVGLFEGVVHMLAIKPDVMKFSQIENLRIGLTGGSVATWDGVIERSMPELTVAKKVYPSTGKLAEALKKGEIGMAVMVGAKPQPWILKELSVPGIHLVEFDRLPAVTSLMTTRIEGGKTIGFLGKRPVGPTDYANLKGPDVVQLTTRTVLATSRDVDQTPAGNAMTKKIFSCVKDKINDFRATGHESWSTVSTMNDPGGIPWANIR